MSLINSQNIGQTKWNATFVICKREKWYEALDLEPQL